MGVCVLRTPVRAPKANSVCERFSGALRRECLDYMIPINERHLQMTIKEWGTHYNGGRPYSSPGPGLPGYRNPPRTPFQTAATDTNYPPVTVWRRMPCSVGYIMNIAW